MFHCLNICIGKVFIGGVSYFSAWIRKATQLYGAISALVHVLQFRHWIFRYLFVLLFGQMVSIRQHGTRTRTRQSCQACIDSNFFAGNCHSYHHRRNDVQTPDSFILFRTLREVMTGLLGFLCFDV